MIERELKIKQVAKTETQYGNELHHILMAQGVENIDEYLHPKHDEKRDNPYGLLHMDTAVELFLEYVCDLQDKEKVIHIIVDCDVDGYLSSVILYQYMKELHSDVNILLYIHEGKSHGLVEFIDDFPAINGSELIIVPDASSNEFDLHMELNARGYDILVIDHHEFELTDDVRVPNTWYGVTNKEDRYCSTIILNNQHQREEQAFDNKELVGAAMVGLFLRGVDKSLTQAYRKVYSDHPEIKSSEHYFDLICLALIADGSDLILPYTRWLLHCGIEQMKSGTNQNLFLRELLRCAAYSMQNEITVQGLAYYVAPLINAVIRLGDMEHKKLLFDAFCVTNESEQRLLERKVRGQGIVSMSLLEYMRRECESLVRKQRTQTQKSVELLGEDIEETGINLLPILLVNTKEYVDINSTGLVANALVKKYSKPVLLMRKQDEIISGSGRNYNKCSIKDFRSWCNSTGLIIAEGHASAFGVKIQMKNVERVLQMLSTMKPIGDATYHVFGSYDENTLNNNVVRNIAQLHEVWGGRIEEPIFYVKDILISSSTVTLEGVEGKKITVRYQNMKFVKFSPVSLSGEYQQILSLGHSIEMSAVVRFTFASKKQPCCIVEDWSFKPSLRQANPFG